MTNWTEDEHRDAWWNLYVAIPFPPYALNENACFDFGCQEAEIVNYHPEYKWVWKVQK